MFAQTPFLVSVNETFPSLKTAFGILSDALALASIF